MHPRFLFTSLAAPRLASSIRPPAPQIFFSMPRCSDNPSRSRLNTSHSYHLSREDSESYNPTLPRFKIGFIFPCFMLNYFVFYARFLFPRPYLFSCAQLCFTRMFYVLCLTPYMPYIPMPVMLLLPFFALVFASNFILSLRFLFHWLHLYTPCDALRLLRLTGDSQYLSRGEMMSTRSRQPRNSTKTKFPRIAPHSHDSPTHHTASQHSLNTRFSLAIRTSDHSIQENQPPEFATPSQRARALRISLNINISTHI